MQQNEIWKPVVGFKGLYEVSNTEKIKSLKRNRIDGKPTPEKILKHGVHAFGYFKYTLCKNGKLYYVNLHRIIAQAFIPNPHNLPCINHIDNDPTNNCISNLEWCTNSHNSRHAYITGRLDKLGEKNSMSKLTEKQVLTIFNDNRNRNELADRLGVSYQAVSDIKAGRRWGWLTGKSNAKVKKRLIEC